MARRSLDKLLSESTLFSDRGQLDESKLTPEQQIALQRVGRSERAGGVTGTTGAIGVGGRKAIEEAMISEAGSQLASGDSLIVPNVQRSKQSRIDERSRFEEQQPSALARARSVAGTRTPATGMRSTSTMMTPKSAAGAAGALNVLKSGLKAVKEMRGEGAQDLRTDGQLGGDFQPASYAKLAEISGQMKADPLIGPQSVDPPDPLTGQSFEAPPEFSGMSEGPTANPYAGLEGAEGIQTASALGGSPGLGITHAASLAAAGITPTTVGAAAAMGEGALNVAAAQSLAQQGAASAAGTGLLSGGLAQAAGPIGLALTAGKMIYGGYKHMQDKKPDSYSYRDVLTAAEGGGQDTRGKDFRVEQDEEGNQYVYDQTFKEATGKDRWIPLGEESLEKYREAGRRSQEKAASRRIGDREKRIEYQGMNPRGMMASSGMSLSDIDAGGRRLQSDYRNFKKEQNSPETTGLG